MEAHNTKNEARQNTNIGQNTNPLTYSINVHKQLLTELFEEASIEAENVLKVKEIDIVHDLSNQVMDICCQIDLDGDAEPSSMQKEEYSLLSWIDLTKIDCNELIPTSRGILDIFDKNRDS